MVFFMDNQNEIYPGGDNQQGDFNNNSNSNMNQYGENSPYSNNQNQPNYPNTNATNYPYQNNQGGYPNANQYGGNSPYNTAQNQGGYPNTNQYGGYPSYNSANSGGYPNNMGQQDAYNQGAYPDYNNQQTGYQQYDPNMNPQGGYQTYSDNAYLMNQNPQYYSPSVNPAKSKIAAGLLAIFLGGFGGHKFYLGYTGPALIMLLCSLLSCFMLSPIMTIIGLIEGIKYLCMTDEEFSQTYVDNTKGWF